MFKSYQSKPTTRKAHKVTSTDIIVGTDIEATSILTSLGHPDIVFKHYETVNVGDYIIYLNADDVYHCNAKVFADRNIV